MFRFQLLIVAVSSFTVFQGSEFTSGSSASWWDDGHASTLYDTIDAQSPQIFDLYFTSTDTSKKPAALDRARVSLERQLTDFRADILRWRDRCRALTEVRLIMGNILNSKIIKTTGGW